MAWPVVKIEQAEAAVARAQQAYEAAEPGPVRDSCLQLLLAEKASLLAKEKALEQVREKGLLQQRKIRSKQLRHVLNKANSIFCTRGDGAAVA